MITYKFLAPGAIAPLSGFRWPAPRGGEPGAWLEVAGPLSPCRRGAHLCRAGDLAHWLHDELWQTELDGEHIEGVDCVIARRARLVRRIDGWHTGGAARFAEACLRHARELAGAAPASELVHGYLEDAAEAAGEGYPVVCAFSTAVALARLGGRADQQPAYRRERAWQSAWIARELIGAPAP